MATTKTISNHALAAKLLRATLKAHNIVAKVTATSSSLNVKLTDVSPWTYEAVLKEAEKYQGGYFDGMQDMYVYNHDSDLPTVNYVSVNTDFNEDLKQKALDKICEVYEIPSYTLAEAPDMLPIAHNNYALNTQSMVRAVLNNTLPQYYQDVTFWTKPVKRIAAISE